jgi:ubiquitin-protein ligase
MKLALTFLKLHDDDIFNWDVALIVINPDSMYYGGYFKASMTFPSNYPYAPPSMCALSSFHSLISNFHFPLAGSFST